MRNLELRAKGKAFKNSHMRGPLIFSILLHFLLLSSILATRSVRSSSIKDASRQEFVLLDNISIQTNVRPRVKESSRDSKETFVVANKASSPNKPAVIDARKKEAPAIIDAKKSKEAEASSKAPPSKDSVKKQEKVDKVRVSPPPPTARNVGKPQPAASGALVEGASEDLFNLGPFSEEDPESLGESDYLKSSIERHRNFAGLCAKGVEQVEVVFEISLNPDGSINFIEYLGDNAGGFISEQTRRALIDQNLRAIELAAPFKGLKASRYHIWKRVKLKFTQH